MNNEAFNLWCVQLESLILSLDNLVDPISHEDFYKEAGKIRELLFSVRDLQKEAPEKLKEKTKELFDETLQLLDNFTRIKKQYKLVKGPLEIHPDISFVILVGLELVKGDSVGISKMRVYLTEGLQQFCSQHNIQAKSLILNLGDPKTNKWINAFKEKIIYNCFRREHLTRGFPKINNKEEILEEARAEAKKILAQLKN